ncbi:MAG: hypothetical protein JXR07_20360 [Reichenbachiella sp.]
MLIIITGLSFTGAHLMLETFPAGMNQAFKVPSAIFLGIAISLAMLAVSTNKDILKPWSDVHQWIGYPLMLAVFSFILLTFFFEVLKGWETNAWYETALYIFLSAFIAYLEYTFAQLYVVKFEQVLNTIKFESKIAQLNKKLSQHIATISEHLTTISQLKTTNSQLKKDKAQLAIYAEQLRCVHCKQYKNLGTIKSHQSTCPEKPSNQKLLV